jgi:hypothetical protein
VNTNSGIDAGDGIVWFQGGGNWFVARNAVTNFGLEDFGLEGVQFNAGPGAGVGNEFETLVNSPSTAASTAVWTGWKGGSGFTSDFFDHSFSMVGNGIHGGRYGQLGASFFNNQDPSNTNTPQRIHFNGNSVEVYPAINDVFTWDYPGAAVTGPWSEFLNASGNTLVAGGHGIHWQDNNTNSLVLKNDFVSASYRGLTYTGTNGAVLNITAAKNLLNQGSSSHLRLRFEDGPGWFLLRNRYRANGSTNDINAFVEAPGSPIHFVH